MTQSEQRDGQLLVAMRNQAGLVQVHGRGTFKISGALKTFGLAAIEAECRRIILDMTHCVGMDSTFMGVLAGLASELGRHEEGELVLVNLSEKTRGLLATLGLDQVVTACLAGSTPEAFSVAAEAMSRLEELEPAPENKCETTRTMLEAHENLVEAAPENYPRFKDVLTFLREDLEKACQGEDGTQTGDGEAN